MHRQVKPLKDFNTILEGRQQILGAQVVSQERRGSQDTWGKQQLY
jgi:hypothetical protein